MRMATIYADCPSICNCCCHVSPMCSASRTLLSCRVNTTKRQGCLPCGEGAQRAASSTCSISSRGTRRAWYLRTLRLPCNKLTRSPVRTGRVSEWVVVTDIDSLILPLLKSVSSKQIHGGIAQQWTSISLAGYIPIPANKGYGDTLYFAHD